MKIAHLCLSCFYIDGYAYQENILISEHLAQGHDVKVFASTETYGGAGVIMYTQPGRYIGAEGAEVVRLPYGVWPHALGKKVRWYPGLAGLLSEFRPEIIFFHGLSAIALLSVSEYVRLNNGCRFIVDCHEDFNNSAKSFISRFFLHKIIYRFAFQYALRQIHKVYAVTPESVRFAIDFYGAPSELVELLPLGGSVWADEVRELCRMDFRKEYGFCDSDVIIAQTGKLDASKKLKSTLDAFLSHCDASLKLVIAGKMTDDVEAVCMPLIESDPRIFYLGWQTPDGLGRVLAGVDFFLQPFGQTVTTQQAMCLGCAILVQDLPSHRWLYCQNGRLFKDSKDLPEVFSWVSREKMMVNAMRAASLAFAIKNLDYKVISKHCLGLTRNDG